MSNCYLCEKELGKNSMEVNKEGKERLELGVMLGELVKSPSTNMNKFQSDYVYNGLEETAYEKDMNNESRNSEDEKCSMFHFSYSPYISENKYQSTAITNISNINLDFEQIDLLHGKKKINRKGDMYEFTYLQIINIPHRSINEQILDICSVYCLEGTDLCRSTGIGHIPENSIVYNLLINNVSYSYRTISQSIINYNASFVIDTPTYCFIVVAEVTKHNDYCSEFLSILENLPVLKKDINGIVKFTTEKELKFGEYLYSVI